MDSSSRRTGASHNAFNEEFLALLRRRNEPHTAADADLSGPWRLERDGRRVAILREWESLAAGDEPEALLTRQETALLLAVALPIRGREPLFLLRDKALPEGFPIESVFGEQGVQVVGWLRLYNPDLVGTLHVLESVVRSPVALANLLEAAGPLAMERVGQILGRRLAGS
jgi:hypothetical protein